MNTNDRQIKSLLFLCAVALFGLLAMIALPVVDARAVRQHEYMVVVITAYGVTNLDQAKLLNDLSGEGWRMVSIWENFLYLER